MHGKQHFWNNGHECEVRCVGRDRYEGYIDGEQIVSGGKTKCKQELVTESSYRTEGEPDFDRAGTRVFEFVQNHVPGRNSEASGVLFDAIEDEVVLDDHMLALEAMYALEEAGLIEFTKVYTSPNDQFVLRPAADEMDEDALEQMEPQLWSSRNN